MYRYGILCAILLLRIASSQLAAGDVFACTLPARAHPAGVFNDDDVGAAHGALACANVILVQMISDATSGVFKIAAVRVASFVPSVSATTDPTHRQQQQQTRVLLRVGSITWWAWLLPDTTFAGGGTCYGRKVVGEITTRDVHATGRWYSSHSLLGLCIGERRDSRQDVAAVCRATLRASLRNNGFSASLYQDLQPVCSRPYSSSSNGADGHGSGSRTVLAALPEGGGGVCEATFAHPEPIHLVIQHGFQTYRYCFPRGGGPPPSCVEVRVVAACVALAVVHTLLGADISLGIMMAAASGAVSVGPLWLRLRLGLSVLIYVVTFLVRRSSSSGGGGASGNRRRRFWEHLGHPLTLWSPQQWQDEMVICGALVIVVCDHQCPGPWNELATGIAVVTAVWMCTHRRQTFLRRLHDGRTATATAFTATNIVTPCSLLLACLSTIESLALPLLLVWTTVTPIVQVIIAGVPFQTEVAYLTVLVVVPFAAVCTELFRHQQLVGHYTFPPFMTV